MPIIRFILHFAETAEFPLFLAIFLHFKKGLSFVPENFEFETGRFCANARRFMPKCQSRAVLQGQIGQRTIALLAGGKFGIINDCDSIARIPI